MNVDKHFRWLVFAQVLLGIVAFCIAERNVGLMLIAGSLTVFSRYVTEGPANWHMPRWMLNLLALAAVAWLLVEMVVHRSYIIVAMGHFTMWLQILQLYSPRTNRDYGQILVLSLLLMIGASILSVSMVYGLLLGIYCVLGLWTVLWFQLKTASDQVTAASRRADDAPVATPAPPVVGQRYRWHLRTAAVAIALICAATSTVVFIVLPRAGEAVVTQRFAAVGEAKAGFASHVNLKTTPSSRSDRGPVLNMRVSLNGAEVGGDQLTFLLRGAALDTYDLRTFTWQRHEAQATSRPLGLTGGWRTLAVADDDGAAMFQADITLRAPGQSQLFTVNPLSGIGTASGVTLSFSPVDQDVSADAGGAPASYSIAWPATASVTYLDPVPEFVTEEDRFFRRSSYTPHLYARRWPQSRQREEIAALAQQVLGARGLSRDPEADYTPDDPRVVEALADHLRTRYRYALTNPAVTGRQDPLTEFLFNHKTGHCELFASGLAALCRSINIPARVVTGYRVSEYNRMGGYYVVRQDDAHAWCEVDLGPGLGWRTVDPTPPAEVAAEHKARAGFLRAMREMYDYVEFRWLRSVVAYDPRSRAAVLTNLKETAIDTIESRENALGQIVGFVRDLPRRWQLDRLPYTLAGFILIVISISLASLVRTLIVHRNRLAALQLTALPRSRRRGLARKLRFYLQMLDLLERHGHRRPLWQSPRHFAETLVRRGPQTYAPVLDLTDSFYAIRFGHLDPDESAIRENMRLLETALTRRG